MKVECPIEQKIVDPATDCAGCKFKDGQRCSFADSIAANKLKQIKKSLMKKLSRSRNFPRKGGHTWRMPPIQEKWPEQITSEDKESAKSGEEYGESALHAEREEDISETQEELVSEEEDILSEVAKAIDRDTVEGATAQPEPQPALPESSALLPLSPQSTPVEPIPLPPEIDPMAQSPFDDAQPKPPELEEPGIMP
jgi:hypothetical protein